MRRRSPRAALLSGAEDVGREAGGKPPTPTPTPGLPQPGLPRSFWYPGRSSPSSPPADGRARTTSGRRGRRGFGTRRPSARGAVRVQAASRRVRDSAGEAEASRTRGGPWGVRRRRGYRRLRRRGRARRIGMQSGFYQGYSGNTGYEEFHNEPFATAPSMTYHEFLACARPLSDRRRSILELDALLRPISHPSAAATAAGKIK